MATTFTTTVPEMRVAAKHVADVSASIDARLRDLENRLSPLLSSWKGGAAAGFQNLKEQWHRDAQQLQAALTDISMGLTSTTTNYEQAEQTHETGFSKITATLVSAN